MNFVLQPWHLLVVILTGWLNRQHQAVIDFLLTEVQVLTETQGKKRILLSDDQRRRLAVKPGMTGPMQVSGRGDLPFEERLALELAYIERYSLRRDLDILLRTLPAVVRGDGAY